MDASNVTNSVGLVLDILGAFLVWQYGLPAVMEPGGTRYRSRSGSDPEGPSTEKLQYRARSKAGFGLLMAGFILQLLSNFL